MAVYVRRQCNKKTHRYLPNACFWCMRPCLKTQLTDDHITPACLGGSRLAYNIARACNMCQQQRGIITSIYGNGCYLKKSSEKFSTLSADQKRRCYKMIRKHNMTVVRYAEHHRFWINLEKSRIGWSGSEQVVLSLLRYPLQAANYT